MVSGHIDGLATMVGREDFGETTRFVFETPDAGALHCGRKDRSRSTARRSPSTASTGARFECMLIPHTLKVTTWNERKVGDRVNLEVDQIARYVARLTEAA